MNKIEIQTKQCTGIVDFLDADVDILFYYYCSGTINYSCKQFHKLCDTYVCSSIICVDLISIISIIPSWLGNPLIIKM